MSRVGEEEVILVRPRKIALHVFLTPVGTGGMKVCRYDDGNTLVVTCPFQGWSYDTDGRARPWIGSPSRRECPMTSTRRSGRG